MNTCLISLRTFERVCVVSQYFSNLDGTPILQFKQFLFQQHIYRWGPVWHKGFFSVFWPSTAVVSYLVCISWKLFMKPAKQGMQLGIDPAKFTMFVKRHNFEVF